MVPALTFWWWFLWYVPSPWLPGVRWPLAGVRWAAVALFHGCGRVSLPSGFCGGLLGLDPRLVSLPLVLWCALVRCALSCRVSPCCAVLVCAVLWCTLLRPAVQRRVVPWCVMSWRGWLRHAVPRRAASCCGVSCRGNALSWCVARRCAAVRCAVLLRVVPCIAVLWYVVESFHRSSGVGWGRRSLDWPASLCWTRA